ncbi:MAG: hypothetical protein E6R04_06310 [Spirochaetes bacterium]|nr:MAG: hypothetical protein E6R04_06310 [Spirochaetota bacterium]
MKSKIAQELIQKQSHLASERSTFEHHWAEIAPLVLTRQDDFFDDKREPGERRTREKFDDTATLAIEHGAAAIEGVVSPRGQQWHGIGLPEPIEDDHESKAWSDRLTKFLFKKRYDARSNFASQLHETYMSLLAFGTGIIIVEDLMNGTVRYKSSHVSEHFYMENAMGRIDTDYRKYRLTARQAMEKFKDKAPQSVRKCVEKEPGKKMDFLHVVMPDVDGESGMPFISYHIAYDDQEMIDVGGFKTFPYIISRWTTSPNEIYGRSPAMSVLSEIKMLNSMRKTDLKARHMAVDPPILAADQSTIRRFSMKPGAMNYGTLDAMGNPLVRPYQSGTSIQASNDGIEQSREFINRAFFLNLFQILVESPAMTATEVLQRAQEKGQLLTPTAGRQMSELLEPIIMREVSIYEDYGLFEDGAPLALPRAMKNVGGEFGVVYTNPLSKMQKSEEGLATERTVQALLPLAQIDPSILDPIDWMEYANIMRDANGAPARLFKSEDRLRAEAEAKQEAQMAQMAIAALPQVSTSIKDIAQAGSYAQQ